MYSGMILSISTVVGDAFDVFVWSFCSDGNGGGVGRGGGDEFPVTIPPGPCEKINGDGDCGSDGGSDTFLSVVDFVLSKLLLLLLLLFLLLSLLLLLYLFLLLDLSSRPLLLLLDLLLDLLEW